MKKCSYYLRLSLIVVVSLFVCSCSSIDNEIIGTWYSTSYGTWKFGSDGSFAFYKGGNLEFGGTYKTREKVNNVGFEPFQGPSGLKVTLKKGLTLCGYDGDELLTIPYEVGLGGQSLYLGYEATIKVYAKSPLK